MNRVTVAGGTGPVIGTYSTVGQIRHMGHFRASVAHNQPAAAQAPPTTQPGPPRNPAHQYL